MLNYQQKKSTQKNLYSAQIFWKIQHFNAIKADPMAALKMSDFIKVLPKVPKYVKTVMIVGKFIVSGAKSRDVKGADDATSKLGDL